MQLPLLRLSPLTFCHPHARFLTSCIAILLLSGCLRSEPQLGGLENNLSLEQKHLETSFFSLFSQVRNRDQSKPLRVYIEGDGSAWITKRRLSSDPTPRKRLVQSLMMQDPSANLAYLARPCQFVLKAGLGRNCDNRYWSSHRFSKEVIEAMNDGLSQLAHTGQKLELVGYSGGGAIAILLAARRKDVISVRTLAGNLDHKAVMVQHGVTPLTQSLNPIDVASAVSAIPQLHWYGTQDKTISGPISKKFIEAQGANHCAMAAPVAGASHHDGWVRVYPTLLKQTLPCVQDKTKHSTGVVQKADN